MQEKIFAIAVKSGNVDKVKKMLEENPRLSNSVYDRWYPHELITECKNQDNALEILSLLSQYGANIFYKTPEEPRHFIADFVNTRYEFFIKVLDFLSKDLRWPQYLTEIFYEVITYSNNENLEKFIIYFLENYSKPDKIESSMLNVLIQREVYEVIFLLIDKDIIDKDFYDEFGSLVKYIYIACPADRFINFLYQYTPKLNNNFDKMQTLLHSIAEYADFTLVEKIKEYDLKYFTESINAHSQNGQTPLHIAIKHYTIALFGYKKSTLDELSENDEESKSSDSDHDEKSKKFLTTIIALMINGARPDAQNLEGKNALEYLVEIRDKISLCSKVAINYSEMTCNFLKCIIEFDKKCNEIVNLFEQYGYISAKLFDACQLKGSEVIEELTKYRGSYVLSKGDALIETDFAKIDNKYGEIINLFFDKITSLKSIPNSIIKIYKKICDVGDLVPENSISEINHEYCNLEEPVYYAMLKKSDKWQCFALPGANIDEATKYILTILLYRSHRHNWESERCLDCRDLLAKINPVNFALDKTEEELYKILEYFESSEDYFTNNYSDDSDKEQLVEYGKQARGRLAAIEKYASDMQTRGNVYAFFTNTSLLRSVKHLENKKPSDFTEIIKSWFKIENRAQVHHDPFPTSEVINDLQELNQLITRGKLSNSYNLPELKDALKSVGTKFFIAQYRGVHYTTKEWNADSRRKHRKFSEIKQPIFSKATYSLSGLDATKDFVFTEEQKNLLTLNSTLLHHQMISLMELGPIQIPVINKTTKQRTLVSYDSPAYASQELYTGNYNGYKEKLRSVNIACEQGLYIENPLDVAFLIFSSGELPTLSTADTPYHALRYAYGIKFYGKEGKDRLRPRWHITGQHKGKAERPYSGKVYTFMLDPADYFSLQPNHIISQQQNGQFQEKICILHERETTFFGALPQDTLVHEHIARYPSFHQPYSNHFKIKYGLDEYMYEQYKDKITSAGATPHSPQNQFYKFVLAEQLCAYHEAALIEDARLEAKARGGWLIYRDNHGLFSLVPPRVVPNNQASDIDKKEAARRQQIAMNAKNIARKSQNETQGWLANLLREYGIKACKNLEHLLSLCNLEKPPHQTNSNRAVINHFDNFKTVPPKLVIDYFNMQCDQLQRCANLNKVSFSITSVLLKSDIGIKPINEHQTVDLKDNIKLLYLGGSALFQLIKKSLINELSKNPATQEEKKRKNEATSDSTKSKITAVTDTDGKATKSSPRLK